MLSFSFWSLATLQILESSEHCGAPDDLLLLVTVSTAVYAHDIWLFGTLSEHTISNLVTGTSIEAFEPLLLLLVASTVQVTLVLRSSKVSRSFRNNSITPTKLELQAVRQGRWKKVYITVLVAGICVEFLSGTLAVLWVLLLFNGVSRL